MGRRDLTRRAGENLILCPRWIKTSKYTVPRARRPSQTAFIDAAFVARCVVSIPGASALGGPRFAEATPWPSAPFYVFLNAFSRQFCNNAMCCGCRRAASKHVVAVRRCDGGRFRRKRELHKKYCFYFAGSLHKNPYQHHI